MDTTYKTQKAVIVFSVILCVLLFFSMLTFFGVVGDGGGNSDCSLPEGLSCEGVVITQTSVEFVIKPAMNVKDILVDPQVEGCLRFSASSAQKDSQVKVSISCSRTGIVETKYKLPFTVSFTREDRISPTSADGYVKGVVT